MPKAAPLFSMNRSWNHNRLVERHVGLDPDFERLVCDEQQHDEQRYFLEIHNRSGIRLQK